MTSNDTGPESAKRRRFLKGGLMAAIGLAVVGITGPAISRSAGNLFQRNKSRPLNGAGTQTTVDLASSMGTPVAISEAIGKTSFSVSVPKSLPFGTALSQARVASDGNMLTLLYANLLMKPLALYDDGSAIAIFQIKEDVLKAPPSFLPNTFQRVSVNGNPGFAQAPSSGGAPGQLQWFSNGKRFSIFANLSVPDLLAIGSSTGDQQ